MKTLTLLLPADLPEAELASLLERKFGAAWFPELHRWSVESDDATVYLDYDRDHVSYPPDHEVAVIFGRQSDPITSPAPGWGNGHCQAL